MFITFNVSKKHLVQINDYENTFNDVRQKSTIIHILTYNSNHMFELGRERKKFLKTGNKINTVAYLALSQGGYEIFEKGHRRKMMKFLIIVYFHNSVAL